MGILHILRSAPDAATEKMMTELSNDQQAEIVKLYTQDVNWARVIDKIFAHHQVVCWW